MIKTIKSLKEMKVGDVLDYSIEIYKANFIKVTLLTLIFYVPFVLIYTLASSYLSGEMMGISGLGGDIDNITQSIYVLLAYYVSLLAIALIYFIYSATIKVAMDASIIRLIYNNTVYSRITDIKPLIKESFRKLPSVMANRFLYYLMIFGISSAVFSVFYILILVFVFAGALLFAAAGATGITAIHIVVIVIMSLLFLALLAAAIWVVAFFSIKFGFGIHAVAIDNEGPIKAFTRSSNLAKGDFWHLAFTYLFGMLLFFAIPQLITIGGQFYFAFNKSIAIIVTTFAQLVGAVFYPFVLVLTTLMYINMKIKKEGLDLELKVDTLLEAKNKSNGGELINDQ